LGKEGATWVKGIIVRWAMADMHGTMAIIAMLITNPYITAFRICCRSEVIQK
jgi:hypothetical protein